MMDDAETNAVLERARAAQAGPPLSAEEYRVLYWQLHALAEQDSAPARTFFESVLSHFDARWRAIAVYGLYHYDLADAPALRERLRWMLGNEPDSDIRIWLSGKLGSPYNNVDAWPDNALVLALDDDPVSFVRENAFKGLLNTAPIPYATAQAALAEMERGAFPPTWAEVERIVAAAQGAARSGDQ